MYSVVYLFQQLATCPVQRMNVKVGKIVDEFLPLAVQRHAQAVTEAGQTHSAVDLHERMAGLNITTHSIEHSATHRAEVLANRSHNNDYTAKNDYFKYHTCFSTAYAS